MSITLISKSRGLPLCIRFLLSLGSCIGIHICKYAETLKRALGAFRITVEAELNKEAPVCFKESGAYIDLKGAQLDMRRKSALPAFMGHCPVHALKANPEVIVRFKQSGLFHRRRIVWIGRLCWRRLARYSSQS